MELAVIPWSSDEPPGGIELSARLATEGFAAFSWHDEPRASYTPHAHDHDESLWVIAGEITFGIDGNDYRLRAGDRLMLPRGTVHSARVGNEGATYLIGQRIRGGQS